MTNQTPHWSNIAGTARASTLSFHPRLLFERHTKVPQAGSATTGMRQNSKTTTPSGGAGTYDLFMIISDRTYAVGLRNTASQTDTLNQTGRLCECWGFKARIVAERLR